jgi:hypothetical protein
VQSHEPPHRGVAPSRPTLGLGMIAFRQYDSKMDPSKP